MIAFCRELLQSFSYMVMLLLNWKHFDLRDKVDRLRINSTIMNGYVGFLDQFLKRISLLLPVIPRGGTRATFPAEPTRFGVCAPGRAGQGRRRRLEEVALTGAGSAREDWPRLRYNDQHD